jgi:hypothetical protein
MSWRMPLLKQGKKRRKVDTRGAAIMRTIQSAALRVAVRGSLQSKGAEVNLVEQHHGCAHYAQV